MKKLTQKDRIRLTLGRPILHTRLRCPITDEFTDEWVHFSDLNNVCYRYGARIYDLRQDGENIEKKQVNGVWFYRIVEGKGKRLIISTPTGTIGL